MRSEIRLQAKTPVCHQGFDPAGLRSASLYSSNSLNSLNSFFRAFHPYERPFIGKLCSSVGYHVIDVAGFSTAYLAKIVLKFPVRYENQRTRFEGRDSTATRG